MNVIKMKEVRKKQSGHITCFIYNIFELYIKHFLKEFYSIFFK